MREKKSFAQRTNVLKSDDVRKKFFLVYEGEKTEHRYFEEVNNLRNKIGINPLIELVPIMRSYSEDGWSNPKKALDRLIQNLEESEYGVVSYETLLNWIMDYLEGEGIIAGDRTSARQIWDTLTLICREKLKVRLDNSTKQPEDACKEIVSLLEQETMMENLVEDITNILKYGSLTFAEGLDRICFIADRDKQSFTFNQYQDVLYKCIDREYGFYLTNPCFEFWLLMHFDDVKELDRTKLADNCLVTAKRRYTEHELRKRLPGFTKSSYDAKALVEKIDTAVENEKKFCEDIEDLENNIGSNIGMLIHAMRE